MTFLFLLLQWSDKTQNLWNRCIKKNVSVFWGLSLSNTLTLFSAKNIYASFKLWKIICQKEKHSCLFCFTCAELFPSLPPKQNFFKSLPDPPWKKSIWRTIENPKTIYLLKTEKQMTTNKNESFIASHLYYDNMKWILQTLWMLSPRNTNCFWSILDNPT